MKVTSVAIVVLGICLLLAEAPAAAAPPWKFTMFEGKSNLSFGFLAQPQYESLDKTDGTGTMHNVFLRRFRLIAGGKLTPKLAFFIESDSPNLGKKMADGKRTAEIFLQDAYLTYTFRPEFQIDAGMIIVPLSHNATQSAASLNGVDFGPYSFLASDPTHSKTGRDYGAQARGYLKKHFEYRFGIFRGNQDVDDRFPLRVAGRFVWYPFDLDTGFFYTGTTLGQRRIFSIGASFDHQADYGSRAVDVFIDQPAGRGNGITVQANLIHYDGGRSLLTLPRQTDWLLESAYYWRVLKAGPFFQVASRDLSDTRSADDERVLGGLSLWPKGHRLNFKMGMARLLKDRAADRTQFIAQLQLFYY
jgi:hypothetical protein